jgi:hypothetical protein
MTFCSDREPSSVASLSGKNNTDLHTIREPQPLALDDTVLTAAHQRLVRAHVYRIGGRVVVSDLNLWSIGVIVRTPVVCIDGKLTSGTRTPRSTASRSCRAFRASEVKGLGQDYGQSILRS